MSTALNVAVLTVSDTRTRDSDTSGAFLEEALVAAGHVVADRQIVIDDVYQLRAIVSQWISDPKVEVILTTGGTGFSGRDSTPEALSPLFDKSIDGFGEVFRALSLEEIRDPLRGEPHAVKGEILGDQSAPTGGAELNGRQFAHGRISASSRRPFS